MLGSGSSRARRPPDPWSLARAARRASGGPAGPGDRGSRRGSIGRFTMDLLGPVPVGELEVSASVTRPGARSRCPRVASRRDPRPVGGDASGVVVPAVGAGAGDAGPPPGHAPSDGTERPRPEGWSPGYLDAVEWRWITGGLDSPGPGVVWMRPPALVEGEPTSPVQRLLACVDSASGVSAVLDVREWAFLNTELTVHVLREPVGEWICLDATTTLGPGSVGVATSTAYDEQARSRARPRRCSCSAAEPRTQRSIRTLPTAPSSTACGRRRCRPARNRCSGRPASSPTAKHPVLQCRGDVGYRFGESQSPTV